MPDKRRYPKCHNCHRAIPPWQRSFFRRVVIPSYGLVSRRVHFPNCTRPWEVRND